MLTYIDGVLLIDLWDALVLPRDIRAAWSSSCANSLLNGRQNFVLINHTIGASRGSVK